ncbi:MAG: aminopeptidase P family protein [Calditrichaeota bacterium]|nr:aminopeptidase P family protein [Calditrichota bacterium]
MNPCLDALRRRFRSLGVANFILTKFSDIHFEESANIRYLCGFSGSNGLLLVTGRDAFLITDGRYKTQAEAETSGVQVFTYSGGMSVADAFAKELKSNKAIRLRGRTGIEQSRMTVEAADALRNHFPKIELVGTSGVVEGLQAVKSPDEIALIRKAVAATDKVFETILPLIKPGIRESELAAEITYQHKKFGAEKDAFEPIVASGKRSALPHGIASDKKIARGDFVTIDMGCSLGGYTSDMTRTVVVGKATAEQRKVYGLVLKAQQAACEAVQAGLACADLDRVARTIIADGGHKDHFTHGLGHGIGMEVHTAPRVSALSKDVLRAGMVVTIEPGVYIPDWGGVRIEDDVVVRDGGGEVLNRSEKRLIEV